MDPATGDARPPGWNARLATIRRLVTKVSLLSLSSVSSMGISLLMFPLTTRILDPRILGASHLTTQVLNFAFAFAQPGLNESAAQSSSKGIDGNYPVIRSLKFWSATKIAALIGVYAAGQYFWIDRDAGLMILVAAVTFPWIARGTAIPDVWLAGVGDLTTLAKLKFAQSFMGLSALGGIFLSPGSWVYGAWLMAGRLLGTTMADWTARRTLKNDRTDPDLVDTGLKMTRPRIVAALVGILEASFVSSVLGLEVLAAWGVAQVFATYFKIFLGNLQITITRRVYAEQDLKTKLASLLPWTRAFFLGCLVIVVLDVLFLEDVARLLVGSRWPDSICIAPQLLAAVAMVAVSDFYGTIMVAERDMSYYTIYNVAGPCVNAFTTLPFGYWGGLYGLFFGRLVYMSFCLLVRLAFMLKYRSLLDRVTDEGASG